MNTTVIESEADAKLVEFSEQELHCIARMLQSYFFSGNDLNTREGKPLYGCTFCKFQRSCLADPKSTHWAVMKKLQKATGVDLRNGMGRQLPFSEFPYQKFLVNANDEIRAEFKEYADQIFSQ